MPLPEMPLYPVPTRNVDAEASVQTDAVHSGTGSIVVCPGAAEVAGTVTAVTKVVDATGLPPAVVVITDTVDVALDEPLDAVVDEAVAVADAPVVVVVAAAAVVVVVEVVVVVAPGAVVPVVVKAVVVTLAVVFGAAVVVATVVVVVGARVGAAVVVVVVVVLTVNSHFAPPNDDGHTQKEFCPEHLLLLPQLSCQHMAVRHVPRLVH